MLRRLWAFESKNEPLAPRKLFLGRLAACTLLAAAIVALSLLGGMVGYFHWEGMSWTDAYFNAAMLLSGMGLASAVKTEAGKLFAACYALYSGLVVAVAIGIVLAPVVHRFMHSFHIDDGDSEDGAS